MLCGRSVQELWEMQRKLWEEGAGCARGSWGHTSMQEAWS